MTAIIDLRSDTVSKPTGDMRRAIAEAEVGDDVFGDDPTVNRLEVMASELTGKEAALFVPSGTMANLVSVMTHTRPGDEILLGDQSHVFNYEVAGTARIALVQAHALRNLPDGSLDPDEVESAIRPANLHTPPNTLLCLENTHNRCGGAVIPIEQMDTLTALARTHGLKVHLDGARLFNAQTALGVPAVRIARDCDTVSFCFSKGLGCPAGSVLCGPREFIQQARRNRKVLGGGMRQAGFLAAAAVFALENNISRLTEDHANASLLADGLREHPAFAPNSPQSNIVTVDIRQGTLDQWLTAFRDTGVLAVAFGPQRMRLVTHLNITHDDIVEALRRIGRVAGAVPV